MPYMYDIAAITAGIPLKQFYTDPQAMVQAQLALHDRVRQDVIAIGSDNFYINAVHSAWRVRDSLLGWGESRTRQTLTVFFCEP